MRDYYPLLLHHLQHFGEVLAAKADAEVGAGVFEHLGRDGEDAVFLHKCLAPLHRGPLAFDLNESYAARYRWDEFLHPREFACSNRFAEECHISLYLLNIGAQEGLRVV